MTTTLLRRGSRGPEVATLQLKLNLIPDGIFGPLTEEAVRAFQTAHGLTADGIVGNLTRKALGMPQSTRRIDKLIIHCTATPEGKDYSVDDIRKWHLARGFSDIGYHYVIYRDGSIHPGRAENLIGAHCTGQNSYSIGISLIGGLAADGKTPKDTRTPAQRAALIRLLRELRAKYPAASIHGHNEFAAKACPSFNVKTDPDLCSI